MNTQSNALPEPFESQRIVPATTSATRPFYWAVRRELWENRSIYIAPLAVAAAALFGYLIATMGYAMSTTNMAQRHAALKEPYSLATALIMAAAFVVSIFYSLEALHSERRDRSILFWKSLPVSDLTTVLSKATIPLVVLPEPARRGLSVWPQMEPRRQCKRAGPGRLSASCPIPPVLLRMPHILNRCCPVTR